MPNLLNGPLYLVHWLDLLIIYCSMSFWESCELCISVSAPLKSLTKPEVLFGNRESDELSFLIVMFSGVLVSF